MLFLRTFIARARPVISLCWYGVAVFGLSLLVLYGLLGIGLQAGLAVVASTPRLSLPTLYWLDHQSSAQLLDGIARKGQVIEQLFRGISGIIALAAMALRVWRRRRQAASGIASAGVRAAANRNSTARDA
ncbi:hypothetical protein OQ496_13575 [Acetobacter suratthaniensis]|uniref:Peptidase n=1 Tax=Acetobacter suratthaniensis TaxID=1502841 RepID=A0ABS3LQ30_9PROT|nr:hypothetical protein [Acetobacter suratthaniensis]MBO1329452.1 hypothetical protein [Acetobacter suratthaniensis]MCX2567475.1 hypothetical protein [Acetobacter suratthaniensis]